MNDSPFLSLPAKHYSVGNKNVIPMRESPTHWHLETQVSIWTQQSGVSLYLSNSKCYTEKIF